MGLPLTLAGSDPSGGAGLELDLKVFTALRVHGAAVATCLTDQDSTGLFELSSVPVAAALARVERVCRDLPIRAMKVGLVPSAAWYRELGRRLPFRGVRWLVLDPVLRPTRGIAVHDPRSIAALRRWVLPRVDLLTPNAEEAAQLLDLRRSRVQQNPGEAARRLLALGPRAVLLKGGHLREPGTARALVVDRLRGALGDRDFRSRRLGGASPRGTGCALSAGIVALLAGGTEPGSAVAAARALVRAGIRSRVGLGRGRPYLGIPRGD